jgi:hypothetical protein
MLSHIASDLHQAYLEEVFKPQLGKPGASTPTKPKSSSDLDGDGDVDSFEKKVRQVVYDVRHIMKEKNVPVQRAFEMRSSKTNYSQEVINTAKEKLGIKSSSVTPVAEESSERMVKVTINYKNGTIDRRNVPYGEISTLRAKPTISSVEVSSNKVSYPAGEKYEKKYGTGGKNTVGDRDGDGTIEPDRHEYAGVKDNAIKKAMFRNKSVSKKRKLKSYGVSEGFSNWRQDLKEVMGVDDEIASRNQKQVKEREVNNYEGGKDAVVKINPEVTEQTILGGHIVESFELDESYVNNVIDIATEFFYNCGLNENGVDIVIEELGEDKFNEFVFDLVEEYFLSEELKKSKSKVKTSKAPKGTKQYQTTNKRVAKQGGTQTQMQSSSFSGTIKKKDIGKKITADKTKEAVEKAKKNQAPSSEKTAEGKKTGIAGKLGAALGAVVKKGREDIKRVQDAAQTARNVATRRGAEATAVYDALRERGKKAEQSATATRARRRATVATGRAVNKAAGAAGAAVGSGVAARRRGASAAGVTGAALGAGLRRLTREELELQEKAESEQQQKLFGLALSVKRGETSRDDASAEVLKIVDSMSEKKIRDFAKTPHSEVPKKKVNEAIANPTPKRKSPQTTQKQKETGRIIVLQKLLDLARQDKLGEDMEPQTQKQISATNLELRAKKMRVAADQQALQQMKKQQTQPELQTQNASYDPEGELVDERTRYAKETGKSFKTGLASVEGGKPEIAAQNKRIAPAKIGGSRQEPKEHGKKPPVAGEPGSGRQDPAHIVALRRAARERAAKFTMDTRGT